jgi:sarcosine/dimethylglycine N-methyltransferase
MPRADRRTDLSPGPGAARQADPGEPATLRPPARHPPDRKQFGPKGAEVTDIQTQTQYSTGASRQAIEQALVAAGKDLGHLRPADLALLEDFHTMGRIATTQLAGLAEITSDDEVLDAGSGIGGTARYIAGRSRCHVVAVDLTEEYCATARWLNQLAGLDDRITVRRADVTDLPFEDATFTLMFSQHVQMNVADKALLYAEARRVLAADGRLAVWDIAAGEDGEPDFPVPWADRPEYSHLTTPDRLRTAIETSGFEIEQWNDLTDQASASGGPAGGRTGARARAGLRAGGVR